MKMMKQLEIEYFWPLTEQIPLDLDFSQCSSHLYYVKAQGHPPEGPFSTGTLFIGEQPTWTTRINIGENITFSTKNTPPLYRRLLYKLLGIRWEKL